MDRCGLTVTLLTIYTLPSSWDDTTVADRATQAIVVTVAVGSLPVTQRRGPAAAARHCYQQEDLSRLQEDVAAEERRRRHAAQARQYAEYCLVEHVMSSCDGWVLSKSDPCLVIVDVCRAIGSGPPSGNMLACPRFIQGFIPCLLAHSIDLVVGPWMCHERRPSRLKMFFLVITETRAA